MTFDEIVSSKSATAIEPLHVAPLANRTGVKKNQSNLMLITALLLALYFSAEGKKVSAEVKRKNEVFGNSKNLDNKTCGNISCGNSFVGNQLNCLDVGAGNSLKLTSSKCENVNSGNSATFTDVVCKKITAVNAATFTDVDCEEITVGNSADLTRVTCNSVSAADNLSLSRTTIKGDVVCCNKKLELKGSTVCGSLTINENNRFAAGVTTVNGVTFVGGVVTIDGKLITSKDDDEEQTVIIDSTSVVKGDIKFKSKKKGVVVVKAGGKFEGKVKNGDVTFL
jgi:hypothetical protein